MQKSPGLSIPVSLRPKPLQLLVENVQRDHFETPFAGH